MVGTLKMMETHDGRDTQDDGDTEWLGHSG